MNRHADLRVRLAQAFRWAVIAVCALLAAVASAPAATVTGRVAVMEASGRPKKSPDNSNVVVWLTPLTPAPVSMDPAPRHFRLLQRNKEFLPHVLAVPVGAKVDFPNLDPFFHNVFSLFEGKRFDLGLYEAGSTHSVSFDRPGICFIFCNIHPQMSAVVLVLRTTYYAVSGRDGAVTIADVLPGRYRLGVWQERCLPATLEALSRELTLSENSASLGTLTLTESKSLLKPEHRNLYGRDYETPTPPSSVYDQ